MNDYTPIFMHHALEHYSMVRELVAVCPDDKTLGQAIRQYMKLVDASGRQASDITKSNIQNDGSVSSPFTTMD